ncbi:hypothetical protein QBC38DRAFT_476187 [Podospora fimiseda]|uniref:Secreted protein n=1 Tax=Podospora fimiseda TaxID=252190 RepID=A0AAN7H021_9PEZI|nr:hypothetical protein QBC38DRAFT_476187 [Podospora fimiseda]
MFPLVSLSLSFFLFRIQMWTRSIHPFLRCVKRQVGDCGVRPSETVRMLNGDNYIHQIPSPNLVSKLTAEEKNNKQAAQRLCSGQ